MAPPLRTQEEVNALNTNFKNIYSIGTDHCAYKKKDKSHDFLSEIPMGIGGIEHSFDIMYHLFGEKCIEKMTINPAITFGLYPKKGHINIGADADFMIYDHSQPYIIEKGHSHSDYTVFEGMQVSGRVESTIIAGKFIVEKRELKGGRGNFVLDD
jgi:dihydropyrimidinase